MNENRLQDLAALAMFLKHLKWRDECEKELGGSETVSIDFSYLLSSNIFALQNLL